MPGIFEEMMDDVKKASDSAEDLTPGAAEAKQDPEIYDEAKVVGSSVEVGGSGAKSSAEKPDVVEAPSDGVANSKVVTPAKVTPEVSKPRTKKTVVIVEDAPPVVQTVYDFDEDSTPIPESTRAEMEAGRAHLAKHAVYIEKMKEVEAAEAEAAAVEDAEDRIAEARTGARRSNSDRK